jgi:hypothetical protein
MLMHFFLQVFKNITSFMNKLTILVLFFPYFMDNFII